ncbi:hypothetical protein REPUB_Repub06bG0145300 [Reevesia pubescens]
MEEGEIVVEDYDSEDDTTDEDLEGPCILLSKEEKKRIRSPWRNTLIVKLLGRSIGYTYLCNRVKQLWSLTGAFQAVDLDNDFYCFRFSNESDFNHVLLRGPWVIANHYLTVRRWTPCFRPEEATINSVAAWIRFPGMPLEYYDNDILKRMGNLLGQTLMIDKNTLIASRGKYARLCVELDLTKPLVPRLHIGERWQKVEYEGLGMVCFHCGCFGHSKEQCLETKGNEAVSEVEKNDDNMEEAGNPVALSQSTEKFGPWMIASKRTRKPRHDSFSKPKQHNGKKGDENQGNNLTGSRYDVLVEDLDKDEGKDRVPSSVEPSKQKFITEKSKHRGGMADFIGLKKGLQASVVVSNKTTLKRNGGDKASSSVQAVVVASSADKPTTMRDNKVARQADAPSGQDDTAPLGPNHLSTDNKDDYGHGDIEKPPDIFQINLKPPG